MRTAIPSQPLFELPLPGERLHIHGLHGGAGALVLARTAARLHSPLCCLAAEEDQLEGLAQDLALFTGLDILRYPSLEIPPYTALAPEPATLAQRLATLHRLLHQEGPCLLLLPLEALLRRVVPKKSLGRHSELVMAGEETERDGLIERLIAAGYERCDLVRSPGDLAVRGGIIDVFAPAWDSGPAQPLRLDFFGDLVESIRRFDPVSQRSLGAVEEAVLLPVSDLLFPPADDGAWQDWLAAATARGDLPEEAREALEQGQRFAGCENCLPLVYPPPTPPETIFDYLPAGAVVALLDPPALDQRAELLRERCLANRNEARRDGLPAPAAESLFITAAEFEARLEKLATVALHELPQPGLTGRCLTISSGGHGLIRQEIDMARRQHGLLDPLIDRCHTWNERADITALYCRSPRQAEQLNELLLQRQIPCRRQQSPCDPARLEPGVLNVLPAPLSRGFDLPDERLHLLAAGELFGDKRLVRGQQRAERESEPVKVEELALGDIVVHRDHGLGAYQGMQSLEFDGVRGDFLLLDYLGGDRLYLPVTRLHLVSKYQGLSEEEPKLDRLGGSRWQTTKQKVTEAVWRIAQELLDIYARRALELGQRFSPPGEFYHELEESFPYDETSGQDRAISEVLEDLATERPMDRLICADVGYGKTEVAVRAAGKVIEDGMQVALLAPTTVLAEQHAATFAERFASFPVRIGCLNRFRSPAEQRQLLAELAAGSVDLVIGTHRLLSQDVRFHRLGLLIVDEEHRFGVSHKEKLKKLRAGVDVLTLTATPIPRTLQMSLLGIRDLSIITTPPRLKRPIKTYVARQDPLVIREALSRELGRGGQVFFVHNRVRSIQRVAEMVQQLVPEARLAIAHGQMPGKVLEDIMVAFVKGTINVLVCTTIIESGLDIPNANTIIINRADRLGLAEIHQLRGRVGRSSTQAYAYLLVPTLDDLAKEAKERLRAIIDSGELGGGFKLAMNDLQIRGGGNLLGVSQSGHIAAVGYDLYLDLLQQTVGDLKRQAASHNGTISPGPAVDCEVKLRLPAYLPESYIADTAQRYQMYRRIANLRHGGAAEADDLRAELEDRYGALPAECDTLFRTIELQRRLSPWGISKLEQGP
ncbi:MAG: transcription-repair coupling factor, partial [Desulfobulbaceae bacterium A2]